MSNNSFRKPLVVALGAAFVGSMAGATLANAADNPFAMSALSGGYRVADAAEGKCGGNMRSGRQVRRQHEDAGRQMRHDDDGYQQ